MNTGLESTERNTMQSPYKTFMETNNENIVRQELITYEKSNAGLRKIIVTRQFVGEDYTDTRTCITLNSAINVEHTLD